MDASATDVIPDSRDLVASIVLFVLQAILSVVLAVSAFVAQLALGACGPTGSAGRCDYALGTGSFYAFLAVVVVIFAAVIAWMAHAHGLLKRSWFIPLLGSASVLAAYVLYVVLMNVSTH